MILFKNNYYEEDERLFSTGDEELDDLLEEVYYSGLEDGYDYFQKEFAKIPVRSDIINAASRRAQSSLVGRAQAGTSAYNSASYMGCKENITPKGIKQFFETRRKGVSAVRKAHRKWVKLDTKADKLGKKAQQLLDAAEAAKSKYGASSTQAKKAQAAYEATRSKLDQATSKATTARKGSESVLEDVKLKAQRSANTGTEKRTRGEANEVRRMLGQNHLVD